MSARRLLVTGGTGFIGANAVRRALESGHRVHLLVRETSDRWRLAGLEDDLALHVVDLADEAAVARVVTEVRPEVILHLATHGAYPSQRDADAIIRANFLGTWNLLKACLAIEYETFVNVGSSSEYGKKLHAMRESDIVEPDSYYAVAKCAQTLLCEHVARAEGRTICTLRLFSVYGPWEEPTRLVPTLIERCLTGQPLHLVDPRTARDFVYVDDAVEALLAFDRLRGLRGETLNIGTGIQRTIREVVDHVLAATGADVPCLWGEMPARSWDTQTWVADATKARRLLGWQARTDLAQGVAATVAWTRARRP